MMKSGLGIRPELFDPIERIRPSLGFLEAHSENYFGESVARSKLLALREDYPISLHGVGLSLGRADDLDVAHLRQLKALVDDVDPFYVSEHLAWSAYAHQHVPDLLPLPLTETSLSVMCEHVDQMQTLLGRQVLVENPSNYLLFDQLQIPEYEFLNELSCRTGCGLLIDVNNIYVSAQNVERDPHQYIESLNSERIGQFHLAGYTKVEREIGGVVEHVLIDTHNQPVYEPVWALFDYALKCHGHRPTLIEWDSDFPALEVLLSECDKVDGFLHRYPPGSLQTIETNIAESVNAAPLAERQSDFLGGVLNLAPRLTGVEASQQHRVWIYQNNIFAAIQEYLSGVYAATKGVVGDDFFKQMVQGYVQQQPPTTGDIHAYGDRLSEMFAAHEALAGLPYLSDVMDCEWALHIAYASVVSNSIDHSSIPQNELLTMPVRFNDSVTLMDSRYPVYEIRRQSLPDFSGEVAIDLSQSQDSLLICKVQHEVRCLVLDSEQWQFLAELQKFSNLLQAIEALQGSLSEQSLSAALKTVFDCQLLVAKD